MKRSQKKVGQILVEERIISAEQLKVALEEQRRSKHFIGHVLVRMGFVRERDLLKALSEQFNIPFISLRNRTLDWAAASHFNPSVILDDKCLPISEDEWSVTFAINNPLDVTKLQKAEAIMRPLKAKIVLVARYELEEAIEQYREHLKKKISTLFE